MQSGRRRQPSPASPSRHIGIQVILEIAGAFFAGGRLWLRAKALGIAKAAQRKGADVDINALAGKVTIRHQRVEDAGRTAGELKMSERMDLPASAVKRRKPK